MAAFEHISNIRIRPLEGSEIDIRAAKLPSSIYLNAEYDPRKYREPKAPIKIWMAYFNLFRTAFGAGVLGLPLAVSQTGYIFGTFLALGIGFLICHSHMMLLSTLNEISRQLRIPYISYRYGFRMALLHGPPCFQCFGHMGPTLIGIFMVVSQVGICTVYVIFTAHSLNDLLDWDNLNWSLLILLPLYLVLVYYMKTLKNLAYISMFGNIMNIGGLTIVTIVIIRDHHDHGDWTYASFQPIQVLLACGTYLFNLSVVGVILAIDKSLEDPTQLTKRFGILQIGTVIPVIVGTIFGILGYWSLGAMHENILRSLPYDDSFAMVGVFLYMIAIAFAYPIQCYPGIQIIIEVFQHGSSDYMLSDRFMYVMEQVLRPLFVLLTFFIAYLAPFQTPFVAFVGNFCTIMVALVFPAMMEISVLYPGPFGKGQFILIKDIIIILLGLLCWSTGIVLCGYLMFIRMIHA